jgi:hypothetical protein
MVESQSGFRIAALSRCQGTRLRVRDWDTDFNALVNHLASKAFPNRALGGPAKTVPSRAIVALHVLTAKARVPHWSDAAEVKFSITNLAENPAKLTGLELQVLKRIPIRDVEFKKAGAPVAEFQLEANIGNEDHIDLLRGLGMQFILPPGSSDAFSLALRGPEGFLIEYCLRLGIEDLVTRRHSSAESDTLEVVCPIRSVKVLKDRTTGP